ncbi:hypothetical protein [Escherichia Stx1 converting phage]|uniref:Uncharacterized protein n=2 Tax=Traversvirus TaxID=1981157 RepID=Q7Y2S3_9CAUD|nr:hypothetical protein Stx1_p059 [Escherichia Stx1 converting phage]NP_859303.1 hypothetical protein Stx2II_p058 [Escherichia phage Stx2 II]BAB87906.1 hypothetical protein [Stx2 converting phage I]BAC77874.1 hypothetical protein [Escherichia Stx1 converting phage]BAC78040.1 hypothetical protein [Escherichia phage Stx2 II]
MSYFFYALPPACRIVFRLRRNIATIQRYHCQGISISTFVRQFCVVRFREQFAQRLRGIIPVFQRFTQCFSKLCITVFCRALNFFTKVFNFFAPDFTSAHGSFPVSRDSCFRFRCDCLRLRDVTISSGLSAYFCLLCKLRQ